MTLPGRDRAAPALVIGSHLDSVPHGGNFDGAAGVLAGLASVAALQSLGVHALMRHRSSWASARRRASGSRYPISAAAAAWERLPDGALDVRRVDTGRTLADHIAACGGNPVRAVRPPPAFRPDAPARVPGTAYRAGAEPGGSRAAGRDLHWYSRQLPLSGRLDRGAADDHVGLPRRFRRDAAVAGAEFAMALDALWAEHEARGVPMACTLGRFHTDAAEHGMTIVPGRFHFSLDVRAYEPAVLALPGRNGGDCRRRHRTTARCSLPPRRQGAGRGRAGRSERSRPAWSGRPRRRISHRCKSAARPRMMAPHSPRPGCRSA